MNLDLIYTVGIGNLKSQISISVVQLSLYMLAIDMSSPRQGVLIAFVMAILMSFVSNIVLQYYNSPAATIDGTIRYVRTLEDKINIFRRVNIVAYLVSMIILTFLYMVKLGIANYYIYSAPVSILILFVAIIMHDESITKKYNELKTQTWVFDYNKTPVIKSIRNGKELSITMFDDYNNLFVDESEEAMEIDNIFKEIPPGSKVVNSELMKPNFQLIDFNEYFKYTIIGIPKGLYLKCSNKQEDKLFSLYIDVLSKYKGLYDIDARLIDCIHTNIEINKETVEAYMENSDYVRRFVSSKDTKVGQISIILSEKIASLPVSKFVEKLGKKVPHYELKKVKKSLYVVENMSDDNFIETDISYLQRYMSLNLDDYYEKKIVKDIEPQKDKFHSMKEKIEEKHQPKIKEIDEVKKTLYQLNIKGELIYIFLEDIESMAEFDELIIANFINKDIENLLNKINKSKIS